MAPVSIHNSNEPLYVVDGVVRETGLDGINPDDIASMRVLKDASSTAIYGSRGANGVVLIKPKAVRQARHRHFRRRRRHEQRYPHMPKVMGTREYAELLTDSQIQQLGASETHSSPSSTAPNPVSTGRRHDAANGSNARYKLSLSKGNSDKFYVSTNYMKREGVVVGTEHERYSAKTNVHAKVYPWLGTHRYPGFARTGPRQRSA